MIFFIAKLIALFAFAKALFLIIKLNRFVELYGKSAQAFLKYFFICLISYKFIEITFDFLNRLNFIT